MHLEYCFNANAYLLKKECFPDHSEEGDDCGYLPKERPAAFIAPFWSVRKTATQDETVNMQLINKEVKVGEKKIKIPTLVNERALKEGEMLVWYRPPALSELEPLEPMAEPIKRSSENPATSSQKRSKR